jgi:hypothetical protein
VEAAVALRFPVSLVRARPCTGFFGKLLYIPCFDKCTSLYRNILLLPRRDIFGEVGFRIRDLLNVSLLPSVSSGWYNSLELQMFSSDLKRRR